MSLQKLGEISMLCLFMLIVGMYYMSDIHPITENTDLKLYVAVIMVAIVLFSMIQIIKLIMSESDSSAGIIHSFKDLIDKIVTALTNTYFKFLGVTIAYFFLINYVGFFIITTLYVVLALKVLGINKKLWIVVVPISYCVFVYFIFEMLLDVSFPRGFLF